ncbi:hypothetical protein [Methanoregula sp.]|uniref:hypothetical protein n=1 Tax=Methanoregula sp. TaxID=2052170 RepID=UPI002BB21388|nr:hypothetical protein [Methanoregula sp.]HVP95622.1 hypothetical protein [Methanoregula sp.]
MNELLVLMLGIAGVFSVPCSGALLALGKMIDRYPTDYEEKRVRSLASPIESTRLAVISFWALFLLGTWATVQEDRIIWISGLTMVFATVLFLFTAVAFSFAVLCALRRRNEAMIRLEREVAIETARVSLEKTTGVPVPSLIVPAKAKPVRRIPTSAIEILLRQT